MAENTYDAIIIGVGQAGNPLAAALAKAGKRVALIERDAVGGTLYQPGLHAHENHGRECAVAYLARRAADYGVLTGPVTVDMIKVRQRKRDIVDNFRSSSETRIEKTELIDLIYGDAKFTGPQSVEIALREGGTRQVTSAQIFVNTGRGLLFPKLEGLDQVPFLHSTSIMELGAVPEHLVILGGSYIALEFGQMFRRFGSRVSVVEQAAHLLSREDADVGEEMAKILGEDGLEIITNAKATQVSKSDAGIALTIETGAGEKTIEGTHLLVAVGRVPNTDTLGLPAAGIQTDAHGFIQVSDTLETSAPGIYALGDVKGGPAFTHISYDDYRIVEANLFNNGSRKVSDRPIPYTVFTDPQLGRVGLTETEAKKQGKDIQVAKIPMSQVARALETDETRGFMKAIVDSDTKQILGAAILGLDGGEVMAVLEVAMMGRLPYTALQDAVLAHPTLAESLNNLFMSLD